LTLVLRESRSHLNSCYRGDDAKALLHSVGKHTQRELYDGFIHHKPGYYPANPPGYSTHELHNDGAAYSQWPRGGRIPWWACGIDVNDADVHRFIAAAARHGWKVTQTYPHSSGEYHHVNFRRPPLMLRLRAKAQAVKAKQAT
jgi:hypothetical protein